MRCPSKNCPGRLECRSTRAHRTEARTVRHRKCLACGRSFATVETVIAIRQVPNPTHAKPKRFDTKR